MRLPYIDDMVWRGGMLALGIAFGWALSYPRYSDMRAVAMQATESLTVCRVDIGAQLDLTERQMQAFKAAYASALGLRVGP